MGFFCRMMDLFSEKGFTNIILGIGAATLVFVYLLFFLGELKEKYGKAEVTLKSKVFTVDVARGQQELIRGLSDRESISEFGGMLFEFPRSDIYSIWMKNMRFSLDIIWLNKRKVVFFVKNAESPLPDIPDSGLKIFTPAVEADEVLEVRAGMINRLRIQIGDEADIVFR